MSEQDAKTNDTYADMPALEGDSGPILSDDLYDTKENAPLPANDQPTSGSESVQELANRFVDALNLPTKDDADPKDDMESAQLPDPTSEEEKAKFNKTMEVLSRFAEDVVKTWLSQIMKRPVSEMFGDGLLDFVATVDMEPSPELIRRRQLEAKEQNGTEEQIEEAGSSNVDMRGWSLKLAVVQRDTYNMNLDELRVKSPEILEPMQTLLKMAYGYLQYALECYELPDPGDLIKKNVIPSPWGTIYLLGAPSDVPQIGVIAERISIAELRAKRAEREKALEAANSKASIEAALTKE